MDARTEICKLPVDPWGLTRRQRETIHAMTQTGNLKLAARATFVEESTVDDHLRAVRLKMGVRFTALAMVQWDRFARGAA